MRSPKRRDRTSLGCHGTRNSSSSGLSRLPRSSSCRKRRKDPRSIPESNATPYLALRVGVWLLHIPCGENLSDKDRNVARNIANWKIKPMSQMRSHRFESFDGVLVISFQSAFKWRAILTESMRQSPCARFNCFWGDRLQSHAICVSVPNQHHRESRRKRRSE